MKKPILVIGGAGYIGSHMCKCLHQNGYSPVVLDNLVYGHREAVRWGPLIIGNASDKKLVSGVLTEYNIAAVMHFAAFTYVGESVEDPFRYYENNVSATVNLLGIMAKKNVRNFIFSSTCAVYGDPVSIPMAEDHPRRPISPYGRSKNMVELILKDFEAAYGMESVSLRYFNAAGADPEGELGEDHRPETHLIPLILQAALGKRDEIAVFGDDYPTHDGTCIRDYIHVTDLAGAHLLALDRLLEGGSGGVFNLGNGDGYSVKEVIETARKISGRNIRVRTAPRRAGDPPELKGTSEKAGKILGWQPEYPGLDDIVGTAWAWHKAHPNGYTA